MTRDPSAEPRDERGSTLLITILLSALAILIVLVVVSASSLYLERKRLFTLADSAALAGAEAWSLDSVALDGDALDLDLQSEAVRAAVAEYLGDAGSSAETVALVEATSRDGRSATVTLRSVWHAPISTDLVPVTVPVEVTSTARSVFH
ncbi:pilus assembly protein TadG-related protein [Agromyces sp. Marseille-Q5079]|uniref:pilus assembly protein TadG-related protein n=1 Tax=Agromyces sp. Marseille-Q5079 TaxID=3439059 RepID=UPI003D9C9EB5